MVENLDINFIKFLKNSKSEITIYLTTGIKLIGKIAVFSEKSLILTGMVGTQATFQLIYYKAITTIMPKDCQLADFIDIMNRTELKSDLIDQSETIAGPSFNVI